MSEQNPQPTNRIESLASEHAQLLSVIGSELSESSDAIDSLSRNAGNANESSSQTAERADTAQMSATDAYDDVSEANRAATAAREQLETLQQTISEIDEITAILNEIADQTNMLALNASIEAARVGKEGEGFAVVADEVKSLTEEAQSQAGDIEAIVEEVANTTQAYADDLNEIASKVIDAISQANELDELTTESSD